MEVKREKWTNLVLEALSFSRLSVPYWEMLTKSEFKESEMIIRDWTREKADKDLRIE